MIREEFALKVCYITDNFCDYLPQQFRRNTSLAAKSKKSNLHSKTKHENSLRASNASATIQICIKLIKILLEYLIKLQYKGRICHCNIILKSITRPHPSCETQGPHEGEALPLTSCMAQCLICSYQKANNPP